MIYLLTLRKADALSLSSLQNVSLRFLKTGFKRFVVSFALLGKYQAKQGTIHVNGLY